MRNQSINQPTNESLAIISTMKGQGLILFCVVVLAMALLELAEGGAMTWGDAEREHDMDFLEKMKYAIKDLKEAVDKW